MKIFCIIIFAFWVGLSSFGNAQTLELAQARLYDGSYLKTTSTIFHPATDKTICFKFNFSDTNFESGEHRAAIVGNQWVTGGWLLMIHKDAGMGFITDTASVYSNWFPEPDRDYQCVVLYDHAIGNVKIYVDDQLIMDSPIAPIVGSTPRPLHVGSWQVGSYSTHYFRGALSQLQIYDGLAEFPKKWNGLMSSLGSGVTELLNAKHGSELNENSISFSTSQASSYSSKMYQIGEVVLSQGQNTTIQLDYPDSFAVTNVSILNANQLDVSVDQNLDIIYNWNAFSRQNTSFEVQIEDASGTYTSEIKLRLQYEDEIKLSAARDFNDAEYSQSTDDALETFEDHTVCVDFVFDGYGADLVMTLLGNRFSAGGYKIELSDYWGLSFLTVEDASTAVSSHVPTFFHPIPGEQYRCVVTYDHPDDPLDPSGYVEILINGEVIGGGEVEKLKPATTPYYIGRQQGLDAYDYKFIGSIGQIQLYDGVAQTPAAWNGDPESLGAGVTPVLLINDGVGNINASAIPFSIVGTVAYDSNLRTFGEKVVVPGESKIWYVRPPLDFQVASYSIQATNLDVQISNDGYVTYNWNSFSEAETSFVVDITDESGSTYSAKIKLVLPHDGNIVLGPARVYDDAEYAYTTDEKLKEISDYTICVDFIFDGFQEGGDSTAVLLSNRFGDHGLKIDIDKYWGVSLVTGTGQLSSFFHPEAGQRYRCVVEYDHPEGAGEAYAKIYIDGKIVVEGEVNKLIPVPPPEPDEEAIAIHFYLGRQQAQDVYDFKFMGSMSHIQVYEGLGDSSEQWDGTRSSLSNALTPLLISNDGSGYSNINSMSFNVNEEIVYHSLLRESGKLNINYEQDHAWYIKPSRLIKIVSYNIAATPLDVSISQDGYLTYKWNSSSETVTNFTIEMVDENGDNYTAEMKVELPVDEYLVFSGARQYSDDEFSSTFSSSLQEHTDYTYCVDFVFDGFGADHTKVLFSNIYAGGSKIEINNSQGLRFRCGSKTLATMFQPVVGQRYRCVVTYDQPDTPGNAYAKVYIDGELKVEGVVDDLTDDPSAPNIPHNYFHIGKQQGPATHDYKFEGSLSQLQIYHGVSASPELWDGTEASLGAGLTPVLLTNDGTGMNNTTFSQFNDNLYGIDYASDLRSIGSFQAIEGHEHAWKLDLFADLNIVTYQIDPVSNLNLKISDRGNIRYIWNDYSESEPQFTVNLTDDLGDIYTATVELELLHYPKINLDTPLTIQANETINLNSYLSFSDQDESNENLTVEVLAVPSNGSLVKDALVLSVGDQFQADELDQVTYVHDNSTVNHLDDFEISIVDSTNLVTQKKINVFVDLEDSLTPPYRFIKLSIDGASSSSKTEIKEILFYSNGQSKVPQRAIDDNFEPNQEGFSTFDQDISSMPVWSIDSAEVPTSITYDFGGSTIAPSHLVFRVNLSTTVPTGVSVYGSNDNSEFVLLKVFSAFEISNDFEEQTIYLSQVKPLVSGATQTDSLRPTWFWYSNGGTGTFRYLLDNTDLSGQPETQDLSYQPSIDLSGGSHTLYVQEKLADGSWSQAGSFTIVIDPATPIADRVAPTAADLQLISDLSTYGNISELESILAQIPDVANLALVDDSIALLIDNLYAIALNASDLSQLSPEAIHDILEAYANLIEENATKSFPVLSEDYVEKIVLGINEVSDHTEGNATTTTEAIEFLLLSIFDEIARMGDRISYAYGNSNTVSTIETTLGKIRESWRQESNAGSTRNFEYIGVKFSVALKSFSEKNNLDRHAYSNALMEYEFPTDLAFDDKVVFSYLLPFKVHESQGDIVAPFFANIDLVDPVDGFDVSLGALLEPIQLTIHSNFASDKVISALTANRIGELNPTSIESAHLNVGSVLLLISDLELYTFVSERPLALQAPQAIANVVLEPNSFTDINRTLAYLGSVDPLSYTLSASLDEHIPDGSAAATLDGMDLDINVTMATLSVGRVYIKISTQETNELESKLEFILSFDVLGNNVPETQSVVLEIDEDEDTQFENSDITYSDVDGNETVTHIIISDLPDNGSLVLRQNATDTPIVLNQAYSLIDFLDFWYLPLENQNGNAADVIGYKVQDELSFVSNESQITVNIAAVNDPPVAENKNYDVNEDEDFVRNAANGVLENATDVEGEALIAELVQDVSEGTLDLNPDGSFTYTPRQDYYGENGDSFTFKAKDLSGAYSEVRTVTFDITNVPDDPVAVNDQYVADIIHGVTVGVAEGVLSNDMDADPTDSLEAQLVSDVIYGDLTLNPDGSFIYIHTENHLGNDQFTYRAIDPANNVSSEATVTIDVQNFVFTGTVSGADNEGVIVTLTSSEHTLVAHTDQNGDFQFDNVMYGAEYTLNLKRVFLDISNNDTTFVFTDTTSPSAHTATENPDKDVDGDGILDKHELYTYDTNPYEATPDADGDLIPDPYDPDPNTAATGLPLVVVVNSPAPNSYFTTSDVVVDFTVSTQGQGSVVDEVRVNSEWLGNTATTYNETLSLSEGIQEIVFRARTQEGHLTVVRLPIEVNALPPALVFISPQDQATVDQQNVLVKIWSDDSALSTVDIDGLAAQQDGHYYSKWIYLPSEGLDTISTFLSDGTQTASDQIDITLTLDPNLQAGEDFDSDIVLNENDLFPLDQLESVDNDEDGVGDYLDPDDSNAAVKDSISISSHLNGQLINFK